MRWEDGSRSIGNKMAYTYANSNEHKLLTFAILNPSDNKNMNLPFSGREKYILVSYFWLLAFLLGLGFYRSFFS